MAASTPSPDPPYYVLIAHSQSLTNPTAPASTSLSHPVIEYHYADDPPNSLLPQHQGEHILVLDYDPERSRMPTVKSLSPDLAVSSIKVVDPFGTGMASEPTSRSNSIYVIETTTKPAESHIEDGEEQSAHAVLAQFKHRNAVLRHIIDCPHVHGSTPTTNGSSQEPTAISPSSISPQT